MVMSIQPTKSFSIRKYQAGSWTSPTVSTITETSVSLTVNNEGWLTFLCTPTDLEAMAVGFLYNEGLITSMDEIADVRLCAAGDNVDVWLHHNLERPASWARTSGCSGGLTSASEMALSAEELNPHSAPPVEAGIFSPDLVIHLIGELFSAQMLYRQAGGVHTSAISDGGRLWLSAEDIGRHNTLDKLAGRMLMEELDPRPRMVLTTGRISSEMLQKASRLEAQLVVSRTAPSTRAVELAIEKGITLVGYARRSEFQVYAHPERFI